MDQIIFFLPQLSALMTYFFSFLNVVQLTKCKKKIGLS